MMSKGLSRITQFLVLAALLIPSLAHAQGAGGNGVTSLPKIECSIYSNYDKLYFRGNDYVPNAIAVTVTVRNISTDTAIARNLFSNLVKDTRFKIVGGPAIQRVADSLVPGDSASVSYTLEVAAPRTVDGIDQIASIVVSSNANNAFCSQDIWVEHEYYPDLQAFCTKMFTQIIFDDNINDYSPNPFVIKVDLSNANDGASDSTIVRFIGARGVSLDPADSSVKFIGLLNPGDIAPCNTAWCRPGGATIQRSPSASRRRGSAAIRGRTTSTPAASRCSFPRRSRRRTMSAATSSRR